MERRLALRYFVTGAVTDLLIPSPAAPARTDELWKHTCFEAFIRPASGPGYIELNFAPSTQWAAYRFTGYREGMARAEIAPPRIVLATAAESLEVSVQLNLTALRLPPGPCRLALSVVIEDQAGAKSYWALAHPPGRPDFHHTESFACDLPTMEAP
jgi:hypothetical protein